MRIPAKITSSCIWVAIPVDLVILHWYDCGADGRSLGRAVGVRSRDYQIFWDGQITAFSYPWCSAGALRARELRYYPASFPCQSSVVIKNRDYNF